MGGGGGGRARVEGHRRQRDGRVIDLHLPTGREGGRRGGGGKGVGGVVLRGEDGRKGSDFGWGV